MKRQLFSTIIAHCLSQASGNMSQSSGKGLKCRVGISSIHSGHQPVSALSFEQSANCALISCSLDQIPLPVTWHLPIFHFSYGYSPYWEFDLYAHFHGFSGVGSVSSGGEIQSTPGAVHLLEAHRVQHRSSDERPVWSDH